ncbi:hypothetical protein D3C76_1040430 [compost metagenome]
MALKAQARWCFEVHGRFVETTGNHLHWIIATQSTYTNALRGQADFLCRKQPFMPIQQSFKCQRLGEVLGRIEH